jgi:hypothetical protein
MLDSVVLPANSVRTNNGARTADTTSEKGESESPKELD